MNNIVYAGEVETLPENLGNAYIYILPKGVLEIECEQTGERFTSHSGEIMLVPPMAFRIISGGGNAIVMDKPLISFKAVTVFSDDEIGSFSSLYKMSTSYLKSPTILSVVGDLMVNLTYTLSKVSVGSPIVQSVKNEIESNLSNPLYSLESQTLARLPLHPNYIRRIFKAETGMSPNSFLEKKRMELASSLILGNFTNKYSTYSISQISELCGYSDTLYFSKVFKKHYGVSPSAYKSNIK